jgi:hypothetical protein
MAHQKKAAILEGKVGHKERVTVIGATRSGKGSQPADFPSHRAGRPAATGAKLMLESNRAMRDSGGSIIGYPVSVLPNPVLVV